MPTDRTPATWSRHPFAPGIPSDDRCAWTDGRWSACKAPPDAPCHTEPLPKDWGRVLTPDYLRDLEKRGTNAVRDWPYIVGVLIEAAARSEGAASRDAEVRALREALQRIHEWHGAGYADFEAVRDDGPACVCGRALAAGPEVA